MATFTGTNANETISPDLVSATVTSNPADALPSGADDTLVGGGGNDTLVGGGGDDTLVGGSGADTLYGGSTSTFLSGYGKYYQLIATDTSFTVALSTALATTLNGVAGQLVTIHSAAENSFVSSTVANDRQFWLGASDAVTEGEWYWLDGATPTEHFWSSSSGAVGGLYSNWHATEPNNFENEDAAVGNWQKLGDPSTSWNDVPNGPNPPSYGTAYVVVEWNQAEVGDIGPAAGTDTADYSASSAGVIVNLAAGTGSGGDAAGDRLFSIENVIGSGQADTLTGSSAANVLTGLAGDDILDGGAGDDTLDGRAGIDTAAYGTATAGITVSLAVAGPQNTGAAGDDTLIGIENLTGSAFADTLSGNGGANALSGGAGDDTLEGGGGDDRLDGGTGLDTARYASAGAGVTVRLAVVGAQNTGGAGSDKLIGIENLTGSDFADTLGGDGGDNVLTGGAGNDTVTYAAAAGGVTVSLAIAGAQDTGGAGSDTLIGIENLTGSDFADTLGGDGGDNVLTGGAGIDTATYAAAAGGVTVSLAVVAAQDTGGAGSDRLSGFENLTGSAFADSLAGNGAANALLGGDGNDTLSGAGGNDTLDGGAGADSLDGGTGNDLYVVDDAGDVVADSGGLDTVQSSVTYTLAATLENLTLIGVVDLDGTGNGKANAIIGNGGDNILSGLDGNDTLNGGTRTDRLFGGNGNDTLDGGMGKDIMDGGDGNDLFVVDNVGDIAREHVSPNGGVDTVQSSVAFTLSRNVENLTLTGVADIDGTGNEIDNVIVGNGGENVLSGMSGNDTLDGGARQDKLFGGDGDDTLTGGDGNDLLNGGDGNDLLNGGSGSDTLNGGIGNDIFRFDTPLVAGSIATIVGFTVGGDQIALALSVFTQAGIVGPLASAAFHTGSAAHDASDRIIYDAATGGLMYDADGTGAAAASIFATVSTGLTLSAGDFKIV